MRLLLVTLDYPPDRGGVARYYAELVRQLAPGTVNVLIGQPTAHPSQLETVRPLLGRIWPRWLPMLSAIRGEAHRRGTTLLWAGQVLPVGTAAWLLRKLGGLPYVVSTHGMDVLVPQASGLWKRWLLRRVLGAAALVTANSKFTAAEVLKLGVAQSRLAIVYPAAGNLPTASDIEVDQLRSRLNLADAPTILGVGRLVARKGFDVLLSSMPYLWQSHPQAQCLIVGDGPERLSLAAQAAELERPSQVRILTEADDRALAAAYAAAHVFVLPAKQLGPDVEGFGIVCLEAAQAGLPVVTTTAGGVGESVRAGETGFTVPPGEPRALAEAVRLLLASPERAKAMGAAGRAWAATFSWERSAAVLTEAASRLP